MYFYRVIKTRNKTKKKAKMKDTLYIFINFLKILAREDKNMNNFSKKQTYYAILFDFIKLMIRNGWESLLNEI